VSVTDDDTSIFDGALLDAVRPTDADEARH
jgi:hypothetical protein